MDQKRKICEWFEQLKMPAGHASNLLKRVDMEHEKLFGMKSHDCHVFMETLLPIAFSSLPERIWKPMTEISLFFKDLCSSTLTEENLIRMERNIPIIMNMLEKILPPGFWDVMENLPMHLVHEARLGGPVQARWMYQFERETANFCSYYFTSDVPCSRNRPNHHDDGGEVAREPLSILNQPGEGSKNRTRRHLSSMEFKSASIHVLLNFPQVKPFLEW
ncbi:uncharacterized protein LOC107840432 isoform X2 [Capsicum annuum]|uniref:uncharacterized protein LOC107840432 isoform X2 n=1 Tax=Capsicum annuum TaxID=4072 RepID=UPI001FB0D91F|nr:uncharacterized protein LOC107840432 isoform X2 [Capsicum annuum]